MVVVLETVVVVVVSTQVPQSTGHRSRVLSPKIVPALLQYSSSSWHPSGSGSPLHTGVVVVVTDVVDTVVVVVIVVEVVVMQVPHRTGQ